VASPSSDHAWDASSGDDAGLTPVGDPSLNHRLSVLQGFADMAESLTNQPKIDGEEILA
jgi:hypothetical protein